MNPGVVFAIVLPNETCIAKKLTRALLLSKLNFVIACGYNIFDIPILGRPSLQAVRTPVYIAG